MNKKHNVKIMEQVDTITLMNEVIEMIKFMKRTTIENKAGNNNSMLHKLHFIEMDELLKNIKLMKRIQ